MTGKEVARALCPPILWRLMSDARAFFVPRPRRMFSGVYDSFRNVADNRPWASKQYHETCRDQLRESLSPLLHPSAVLPHALLTLIVNSLPQGAVPRILDWAGGTGLRYWTTRPALNRPVRWHVVDNPELAALSKEIRGASDELVFADALPAPDSAAFDVVLVYSSLQYVEAQGEFLASLAGYAPRFIVLPRLMARNGKGYVTSQSVQGFNTPCKVSSIEEIVETLQRRQYAPVLMTRDGLDLAPMFEDDVPEPLRVGREWLLVFERITQ